MKKIGEYTAKGIVSEDNTTAGTPQKIPLFDGSFKTAYRVKEFYIWGATWNNTTNPDCIGKLSKNDTGTTGAVNFMRADDDNQIAWAGSNGGTDSPGVEFDNFVVDPDNLVVEDLYVYVRIGGDSAQPINYMVVMEKFEISESQGALLMARDRADGE